MSVFDSKMTALANEIRELSGTNTPKSINSMTNDVNAANEEVAEQSELLEQIATALEGKASGGSGGNVEAWTGTVYGVTGLGDHPDSHCVYTDENLTIRSIIIPPREEVQITIAANTMIIVDYRYDSSSDVITDLNTDGRTCFVFLPTGNNFSMEL